ncbi:MAG: hypothetical protein WCA39_02190 [Nitrososphaeraceae archaeon]
MPQWKVVAIVTDSSTGVGFETYLTLASNGVHTYVPMPRLETKSKCLELTN